MGNALGTYGQHLVHEDFYHFVASNAALGQGMIQGVGTEAAVQVTDETDGVIALTSAGTTGNTCLFGLSAVFAPASNGPLSLECRVKIPSLTDQSLIMGFGAGVSNNTDEWVDNGTIDGSLTELVALYFDSDVDANQWNEHLATGSTETQQNLVTEVITADEWQVLRVEIDPDGTARTYISDEAGASGIGEGSLRLIALRATAVSTTALYFPEVSAGNNNSTAGLANVDYFHFTANRDWAVD